MPFIHIRSLPFDPPKPLPSILEGLSRDFAEASGIALKHVTATWSFFPAGQYAAGGETAAAQPAASHPILVEFLAPDFNGQAQVEVMLRAIAVSLAERAALSLGSIFIHHRAARSGSVWDAGEVLHWD